MTGEAAKTVHKVVCRKCLIEITALLAKLRLTVPHWGFDLSPATAERLSLDTQPVRFGTPTRFTLRQSEREREKVSGIMPG